MQSGTRRSLRAPPTALYWAEDAVATADRWAEADRRFSVVAVEADDPDGLEGSVDPAAIDCALVESAGDADPGERVETVQERLGSVPTIVLRIGAIDSPDAIVPPAVAGFVTIAPGQDRVALLAELAEQVVDVTARARDRLLLASLFEHIPLSVYVKDRQGRHVAVSEGMIDLVGRPFMENDEGKRHHHPADVRGKTDFDLYPAGLATETVPDDRAVVETGEPIENKVEHALGEEETGSYVLTSKAPWYDQAGTARGVVGVTTEISERKRYEYQLQRQNERLRRLTTALSREIRRALATALGRIGLARETEDPQHFETVSSALERIEHVVESVLQVTRQGERVTESQTVSLAEVAGTGFDRLRTEGMTLDVQTDGKLRADPGRLQHLLEQLFANVRDHASAEDSSAPVTVTVGEIDGGFYVADDGVGIPASDREAVFEPGLGTDAEGGIGLNVVAAIADAHGWTVSVEESERGGARIEIRGVERPET